MINDDLLVKYKEHVKELDRLLHRFGSRKNMEKARRDLDEAVDTLMKIMLIQRL